MSFEDGGDLASFAAIAESTIANKEGKLRIGKPPKLANRVSDHFVSLMLELASISSSLFAYVILTSTPFCSPTFTDVWKLCFLQTEQKVLSFSGTQAFL